VLRDVIQARITQLQGTTEDPGDRILLDANALPIYRGWVATIGIRPDGEVVQYNHEDARWEPVEPNWRLASLVVGSTVYPELRELLPVRPPGIPNCHECGGTGHPLPGELAAIICGACHGLGWTTLT
jgi:hypothetical protein